MVTDTRKHIKYVQIMKTLSQSKMWNVLRATTINAKIKRWIENVVGPQGVGDSIPPKVSFRMKYLFS